MPEHFFLWQLAANPFEGFLACDTVARHHPAYPNLQRSCHTNHIVELDATVETTVEKDGALHPFLARCQIVGRNCGMHHGIDSLLILLRQQKELSQHRFAQFFTIVNLLANQPDQPFANLS